MVTLESYIEGLSVEERQQIVKDYEEFCGTGMVGDCMLRNHVSLFCSISGLRLTMLTLDTFANATIRIEYHRMKNYLDTIKNNSTAA